MSGLDTVLVTSHHQVHPTTFLQSFPHNHISNMGLLFQQHMLDSFFHRILPVLVHNTYSKYPILSYLLSFSKPF